MQLVLDLDFTDSRRGVSQRIEERARGEPKNVVHMKMIYINSTLKRNHYEPSENRIHKNSY